MRGFKGATMNIARFILVCLGAMFVLFPSSIPEVYGSQETLDQQIQGKKQELNKATAEADNVRAELQKSHPNDTRPFQDILKSDIATSEKRLGDLKDAKLIVLSFVALPLALAPDELQRINKKLAPFFRVDEKGNFHLGSGLSWLSLAGVPTVIQAKEVKKMLNDWIAQGERALINSRNQLAILEMEASLKSELAQLERQKKRGRIVSFVLNCAQNEIFEDESTTCSATATYEDRSIQNIYEGVQWDPSRFVDKNGNIKGEEVKKQVKNLPREGYEIKVKFSYGGETWGPVSVKVLPKETSAAIPPPKQVQQQQQQQQQQQRQQQQPRQMTTVPDVVGLEKQTAEYDIAAANLKVRNVRTKRDDHRAGVVIDQDPRPGKSVQVGSPVDLVVSSGTPATIHTLYVDPASKTIEMKDKLPLKALLWHTDGSEKDVTEKATWTGADSTGVFTPTKPGKFQVTASFSGFSGSATITVREPLPPQWSSPISHADDRTPHSTEPPPDAYTYFVFCHPDKGEVVYGEHPQIQDKIMAGPFPGPRNAQFWIEQNCPRWRCTAEGACAKEPAYVSGGQWAVVCDKNDLHVYTTKSPPDLTRYWIMQQGLLGGPDADLWIQKYCPTRLCTDGGGCAKADVPRKGGKWAVVCDKNNGSVALTEYPDVVRKWIWVDNLFGEPDARLWTNQNCPSWRCDRNGKCLPGNQPLESTSGRTLELPPDFSHIADRYRAKEQRRDRQVTDRNAADASRYGTGLTTSPQATTNDQTTPTTGGTTTTTTPGVTSPTTPPTGGTGPTTPTKGGTSQTPTGGTGPTGVTSTGTPTTPGQFPEKKRYYIVKKTASGIWQWKNYKCTENIYDVIITQDQNAQQDINAARRKWDEDNQKCKQKGCNRGALYTRMWWPQTWSFSIYQGPLDKPPALDKIPKNDQKCTGEMR